VLFRSRGEMGVGDKMLCANNGLTKKLVKLLGDFNYDWIRLNPICFEVPTRHTSKFSSIFHFGIRKYLKYFYIILHR